MGYEGLSECFASWVAHHTNIKEFAPITDYYMCDIVEDSNVFTGCYSKNFLNPGETCLTIGRLLALEKGNTDRQMQRLSTNDRIKTVVDTVIEVTGITNFGEWLTALLEFDSLILNEDRHTHNIAVIETSNGKYKLMPLFDNGAAFCADTNKDYPLSKPVDICIRNTKAKPFNSDFKKQVSACRELYGSQLRVELTANDISTGLLDEFHMYSDLVRRRVLYILRNRLL